MTARHCTPTELAAACATGTPFLLGLDVDGVLAPIVEHAHEAALLDGIRPLITELAETIPVAVVSGRAVADLEERFSFPPDVEVIGSHGLERRGHPPLELTPDEQARLDRLTVLAEHGREAAGDGAWIEHKPASVVLHVRSADEETGRRAVDRLLRAASGVEASHAKPGHAVVELLARRTSKATAIEHLRRELGVARVVFAGDDHTDEEVFASLHADDVSVRVGPGPTAARCRLQDPSDVRAWLQALRDLVA